MRSLADLIAPARLGRSFRWLLASSYRRLGSQEEQNQISGDTANGHVVLDGPTQTGTVTLAGGTGELANLKADLVVAPLAEPSYSWDGPYSY